MSYNVAICLPPVSSDDEAAWGELQSIIDANGSVPAEFRELHDRLTARYPCICDLPDDEVDNGVWSDGPLINDFGHRAAVVGMVYPRVDDVLPFLVKTANGLGMVVFDWATKTIYRPKADRVTETRARGKPWWRFS